MLDVDHFKQVNDDYGHAVGDRALRAIGETLRANTRVFDLLARYGGEEFVVVLPGSNPDEAVAAAERLRAAVEAMTFAPLPGRLYRLTISIGVACGGSGTETTEALLREADDGPICGETRGPQSRHARRGQAIAWGEGRSGSCLPPASAGAGLKSARGLPHWPQPAFSAIVISPNDIRGETGAGHGGGGFHHRRRRLGRLHAGQSPQRGRRRIACCCWKRAARTPIPWIHIPAGFYRNIYNPKVAWYFETEPVPELNNRRIPWPRGKVLGGSSSINGLIYIRGQRQDFDLWRQLGNAGWSYDDVLPYFRKAENQEHGADEFHGGGGPLAVSDLRTEHPLHDAFIAAAQEAGYPYNRDFNGAEQEGVGPLQLTVRGRRRCSAAAGYLQPAMCATQPAGRNPRADASRAAGGQARRRRRIQPERRAASGAGAARGAAVRRLDQLAADPATVRHRAGCAAAIGSASRCCTTCRASARTCRTISADASSIAAIPGVSTMNEIYHNWLRRICHGMQYRSWPMKGPLMTGAGPIGLFVKTRPELESPDVQYQFLAGSAPKVGDPMHHFPACTLRWRSRAGRKAAAGCASPRPIRQAAGDAAELSGHPERQGHHGRRR